MILFVDNLHYGVLVVVTELLKFLPKMHEGHASSCRQRIRQFFKSILMYWSPLIANILFCQLSKRSR